MMQPIKTFITFAVLLLPLSGYAQFQNRRQPVDTLVTTDGLQRVVLYSNGTWSYIGTTDKKSQEQAQQAKNAAAKVEAPTVGNSEKPSLAEAPAPVDVFGKDWVLNTLSVYHTSLSDLPSNIEIVLASHDTTSFHCPVVGAISSRYGYRNGRRHTGTDVPLKTGDPVYAPFDGKVRLSKSDVGGYGNLIVIRHNNGLETYYGHLSRRNVDAGDVVKAGDIIGLGGSTGHSTGPHLHFETRYQGFPFDPERIIDFPSGILRSTEFDLRQSYFGANSRYAASGNNAPSESEQHSVQSTPQKSTSTTPSKSSTSTTKKTTSNKSVYHKIVPGDNLTKVAKRYGTTVQKLCELNKIKSTAILQAGKSLRVK